MAKEPKVNPQSQAKEKAKKPERPFRATNLMKIAMSKKLPVEIRLMSGEVIKDAVVLDIDVYEITVMVEGKLRIIWKHAIESMFLEEKA